MKTTEPNQRLQTMPCKLPMNSIPQGRHVRPATFGKPMKSFFKAAGVVGIVIAIYVGWAFKMTAFGHEITRTKLDHYTVRVERIPFKFSIFTPLYGGHMFSGYVKIRIYSGNMEMTSYSVYGDSFYPRTANIIQQDAQTVRVMMTDGFDVKCTIRDDGILWSR